MVAARQPLGLVEVLLWWCPVCQSQLGSEDIAFLFQILGCSLNTFVWIVLVVVFLDLMSSFWSLVSWRWSIGCDGSKKHIFVEWFVFRMSHRVGKQFWFPFCSFTVFIVIAVFVFGIEFWAPLFLFPELFWVPLACFFWTFYWRHWFL